MPYYFAYGSNMDNAQMTERCPNARYIGKGYLPDYKLAFTRNSRKWDSAVADILVSPGETVWGIIYIVTDEDLKKLDIREGHPTIYRRKSENVMVFNNSIFDMDSDSNKIDEGIGDEGYNNLINYKPLEVEVYEVVKKELNLFPKLNYLNKLQDAAFEYSFPKKYQESLHRFGLNDYDEKLKKSLDVLLDFQSLLEIGEFPKKVEDQEEWGGAELVITGKESRRNQLNRDYPNDLVVLTPHWREVSWLVQTLYWDEKIAWQVNASNKYFILNQLGSAALEYQKEQPNDSNPKGICLAILYRAYKVFTSDFYKIY